MLRYKKEEVTVSKPLNVLECNTILSNGRYIGSFGVIALPAQFISRCHLDIGDELHMYAEHKKVLLSADQLRLKQGRAGVKATLRKRNMLSIPHKLLAAAGIGLGDRVLLAQRADESVLIMAKAAFYEEHII
jgi:antitoxin component of MazEF toxin-antitoxin module